MLYKISILVNMLLAMLVTVQAVLIIKQRATTRASYVQLYQLQHQQTLLHQERAKLDIEIGLYTASINLEQYSMTHLGLIPIDKQHIRKLK